MSEPDLLAIRYTNELADHLDVLPTLYRESIHGKIDRAFALILVCCSVYAVNQIGIRWESICLFLIAAVLWFNFWTPYRWRLRRITHWKPYHREEYKVTFRPEGIHFENERLNVRYLWEQYEKVVETPKSFLLCYGMLGEGAARYTVIPKRAFSSEAETNDLRMLLARKVRR